MSSGNGIHNKIDSPLYNSRLIKNYVEYTQKHYPDIDIDSVLSYAGIATYELEDQGHWFTQQQVDRFHEILSQKTGDTNISREVGRYAASSKASGPVKQYALGFMSPAAAYWMLEKMSPSLSRSFTLKTRKLGPEKVEVTSIPNPGVVEKPYQCENRIGFFESVAKLFTEKFAKIEHPTCIHRGEDLCRYIITWEKTPSLRWRGIRNYLIFLSILVCGTLYFFIPAVSWPVPILFFTSLVMGISFYSAHLEKDELAKNIKSQGDAARLLLDQINISYNNALLVQEIGQATSMLLDIQNLPKSIMDIMEERLDFDRGGIWLANKEKTRLCYNVGYGYKPKIENLLRNSDFHLDHPQSKGPAIQAFKQQKPYLVNDIAKIEKDLSKRSLSFIKRIGARSFICAPVIYEGESLGVMFVDNLTSKRPLSQSDISLLMGIAPQIAISIHNAISYQRLQESKEREHNLRKLFERYVPAPIIKQYVDSKEVDLFRGEESFITALFLDIRGFTASSEAMDARNVVSFLNEYFERCSLAISKENGHINKYTGDGFFAIFGAPEKVENHAIMAFNAACKILELSERLILEGKPMGVGIGLNTGRAILGNIGSQTKIEYTAVGDTINTAARLQEFTKLFHEFPVIMSRDAWKGLVEHPYHSAIKNLGIQKIRGKKQQLEAFGFNPLKGHILSVAIEDRGFMPLDKKAMGENVSQIQKEAGKILNRSI
ncbi:MAG TPA: adenylate/guanylate cyclase domain-containing protein [Desulfatiglandales bacterium]|nr:adenylate/guanylate cyclase domain-containing protein [Desulfatiglandales bacterium]